MKGTGTESGVFLSGERQEKDSGTYQDAPRRISKRGPSRFHEPCIGGAGVRGVGP